MRGAVEELSERLRNTIIESVRHTDTVTRYGKGQYLVLLINTTEEDCSVVSRRISSHFIREGQRTSLSYSVSNIIVSNR